MIWAISCVLCCNSDSFPLTVSQTSTARFWASSYKPSEHYIMYIYTSTSMLDAALIGFRQMSSKMIIKPDDNFCERRYCIFAKSDMSFPERDHLTLEKHHEPSHTWSIPLAEGQRNISICLGNTGWGADGVVLLGRWRVWPQLLHPLHSLNICLTLPLSIELDQIWTLKELIAFPNSVVAIAVI